MTPSKADSKRNVILCKDIEADVDGFEFFFKTHFSSFCVYCVLKFGFDTEAAKEAVHITFIKLWESRHRLQPNLPAKAYCFRILNNVCLDRLRKTKSDRLSADRIRMRFSNDMNGTQNLLEAKELAAEIDKAVAALPPQMQKIFVLHKFEGLRYTEIAAHLNISVKTVETQMSRALVRLRDHLAPLLFICTLFFRLPL